MVSTPRRVYCRLNICLLCAFSFVQTEISASGEIKQTKLHNEKHRLNEDKVSKIKLVVSDFTYDPVKDRDNGVCRKCFNSIEKIIKREQEKIVFLTTKYEQIVKLEHLLCPKVGGAQTHLCPPPPLLKVGRHVPPPPCPPLLLRPCTFTIFDIRVRIFDGLLVIYKDQSE